MSRFLLPGGLLLLAAGPLVAPALPAGPGSLLDPPAVLVGAGIWILFWLVFVWPVLARERAPRRIAAEGLELLAVSVPVIVLIGESGNASPAERYGAIAILAAVALVTGSWLAGPGRNRERDRWFAAGAVLVLAGLPIANWGLNELGASRTEVFYRLSPLLTVRGVLTGAPGAEAGSCLTFLAVVGALLVATRFLRAGTVATGSLLVLVLPGVVRAQEVEPIFGEFYVPGRPVPLFAPLDGETVSLSAGGAAVEREDPVRDWLEIPGAEGLRYGLRPTPPGTWIVVHGAAPPGLVREAEERGFAVGRSLPVGEAISDEAWLSPDAVIDVGGLLGDGRLARLAAAGVRVIRSVDDLPEAAPIPRGTRRPWEEQGRILDPDDLAELFPARGGFDRKLARTAFLLTLGWVVVAASILRWGRGRRAGRTLLTALAGSVLLFGTPKFDWTGRMDDASFVVRAGERVTEIRRLKTGRHPASRTFESAALPQPLVGPVRILAAADAYRADLFRLPPRSSRMFLTTRFAEEPAPDGPPDLLIGPAGLATPGEAWLPAGEFLRRLGPEDRVRATAVRKLLPAGDLPDAVWEVRFTESGMDVRPSR